MKFPKPGVVLDLDYDCRPRGCDDSGGLHCYWTGEVDAYGKLTFIPCGPDANNDPIYLFPDEIVAFEPAFLKTRIIYLTKAFR